MTPSRPLGSIVTAPASTSIMATFHSTNETIETLVTSVYLLGYAFGPLVLAPLSELYGRAIVYNVTNFGFLIWTIACGLATNLTALIVFRFLSGLAGSAGLTIGAGTIADMIPLEKRGLAMMGWILGPVFGPTVGPLSEFETNATRRNLLTVPSCCISCRDQGLAVDFLVRIDTRKPSASRCTQQLKLIIPGRCRILGNSPRHAGILRIHDSRPKNEAAAKGNRELTSSIRS